MKPTYVQHPRTLQAAQADIHDQPNQSVVKEISMRRDNLHKYAAPASWETAEQEQCKLRRSGRKSSTRKVKAGKERGEEDNTKDHDR